MVSGTVHSLTHKQLALAFDYAGEQEVTGTQDRVPSYRVRMAGRNLPGAADAAPKGAADYASASSGDRFAKVGGQVDGFWVWLTSQPKRVRFSIGMIIFFFLVNLLTGSILINPWFVFPSAPFAIFAFLSLRNARNRDRLPPPTDIA